MFVCSPHEPVRVVLYVHIQAFKKKKSDRQTDRCGGAAAAERLWWICCRWPFLHLFNAAVNIVASLNSDSTLWVSARVYCSYASAVVVCCCAGHWTYWARQELEGHWHLPAGHSGGALPHRTLYCAAVKRQVFLQTHLHIGIENIDSFSSVFASVESRKNDWGKRCCLYLTWATMWSRCEPTGPTLVSCHIHQLPDGAQSQTPTSSALVNHVVCDCGDFPTASARFSTAPPTKTVTFETVQQREKSISILWTSFLLFLCFL